MAADAGDCARGVRSPSPASTSTNDEVSEGHVLPLSKWRRSVSVDCLAGLASAAMFLCIG